VNKTDTYRKQCLPWTWPLDLAVTALRTSTKLPYVGPG